MKGGYEPTMAIVGDTCAIQLCGRLTRAVCMFISLWSLKQVAGRFHATQRFVPRIDGKILRLIRELSAVHDADTRDARPNVRNHKILCLVVVGWSVVIDGAEW